VGAFYGPFRKYGKILKEYYDKNGNLKMHIRISESQLDVVEGYIKNNSNGEAEYHIVKD
jgi:ribosome maturation protein Sdo1